MTNEYENAHIFYEWSRMFDPQIGGVAQEPRKTKENGVKNL
jgi:hypothetical protein